MRVRERYRPVLLAVVLLTIAAGMGVVIALVSGSQLSNGQAAAWTPRPTSTVVQVTPATATRQSVAQVGAARVTPTTTVPTVTATRAVLGSQPTPTAAPTTAVASTVRPSSTPPATLAPVATPIRTSTPTSPRPTQAVARRTATPRSLGTPGASAVSPPTLREPGEGNTVSGVVTFQWQPTGPLPAGAAYEVVCWHPDDPADTAQGLAAPTDAQSLAVDLNVTYQAHQLRSNRFYWTVLIVQRTPYVRLTQPGQSLSRSLNYTPPGAAEEPVKPKPDPAGSPVPPKP